MPVRRGFGDDDHALDLTALLDGATLQDLIALPVAVAQACARSEVATDLGGELWDTSLGQPQQETTDRYGRPPEAADLSAESPQHRPG
jgi:hypothetical protein